MMRRLTQAALLLFLLTLGAMAQSVPQTPNLFLNIPPTSTPNWGGYVDQNFSVLDSYLSGILPLPLNVRVLGYIKTGPVLFAKLPVEADGEMIYVSDASSTNPCSGGGTGALAIGVAGQWNCNSGSSSGGSSVFVNGTVIAAPNFNPTTPSPDAGFTAGTFKVSGSNVILEFPSPIALQVNSTPNNLQTLLNLIPGTNVTILDNGSGGVTISSLGTAGGTTGNLQTKNSTGVLSGEPVLSADQFTGADVGIQLQACLAGLPSGGGTCDGRGFTPGAMTTVNIDTGVKSWTGTFPVGTFTASSGSILSKASGNLGSRYFFNGAGITATTLQGAGGSSTPLSFTDINLSALQDFTVDMNFSTGDGIFLNSTVHDVTTVSSNLLNRIQVSNPGAGGSGLHLKDCSGCVIDNGKFDGINSPTGSAAIRIDGGNGDDTDIRGMTVIHFWDKGIDNTQTASNPNDNSGFLVESLISADNTTSTIYSTLNPLEPIVVNYAFDEGSQRFFDTNGAPGNGLNPAIWLNGLYLHEERDPGNCWVNYTGTAPFFIGAASYDVNTAMNCFNSSSLQVSTMMDGDYPAVQPYSLGTGNSLLVLGNRWGLQSGSPYPTGVPHTLDIYSGVNATHATANLTQGVSNMPIYGSARISTVPNYTLSGVVSSPSGGSTTWGYEIVFRQAVDSLHTGASAQLQTTTGPATLDSTHFTLISWGTQFGGLSCADFLDIYRITAGGTPSTTGKIISIAACQNSYEDVGTAGDSTSPPSTNNTGFASVAGQLAIQDTPVQAQAAFSVNSSCAQGANTAVCGMFLGPNIYVPGSNGGLSIWHDDALDTIEHFDSHWNTTLSQILFRVRTDGTAITALKLTGDGSATFPHSVVLQGHINTSAANSDISGTISISSATSASHTFSVAYTNAPNCTLTPDGDPTSVGTWWVTTSTSAVTANVHTSGTISFTYNCAGAPN